MTVDVERTKGNYAHAGNLKSRMSLYDHREPRIDPVDIAAGLMPAEPGARARHRLRLRPLPDRLRADHPEAAVVAIDAGPGCSPGSSRRHGRRRPGDPLPRRLRRRGARHAHAVPRARHREGRRRVPPHPQARRDTPGVDQRPRRHGRAVRCGRGRSRRSWAEGSSPATRSSSSTPRTLPSCWRRIRVGGAVRGAGACRCPNPALHASTSPPSGHTSTATTQTCERSWQPPNRTLDAHFAVHDRYRFEKALVFYRCR